MDSLLNLSTIAVLTVIISLVFSRSPGGRKWK
jgi:hypothetical protein